MANTRKSLDVANNVRVNNETREIVVNKRTYRRVGEIL